MASSKTNKKKRAEQRLSRLKWQKQVPKHKPETDDLLRKVKQLKGMENARLEPTTPGQAKMSEILLDFLSPYLSPEMPDKHYEGIIRLGTIAWNLALLPDPNRKAAFDEAVSIADRDSGDGEFFGQFLNELVKRKETHFPNVWRLIATYDVKFDRERRSVSVASVEIRLENREKAKRSVTD